MAAERYELLELTLFDLERAQRLITQSAQSLILSFGLPRRKVTAGLP